jgi:DAK2 domain fusion protein YloV
VLDTLDAAAVHRWCGGGLEALRAHQHEIDELNVYPVPDGDTGTNLVLTLTSAQEALDEAPAADDTCGAPADESPAAGEAPATPLGRAMRRMARGALLGARGNSGVIVSQILRGMADSLATAAAVRGGDLARALRSASEAAYAAVARPVEGTVLSVVAAAAEGAGRIKSDDLVVVAREAARAASEALARTPQQLPVLARAGVVDAGGRGLCLLLDALVVALTPAGVAPELPSRGRPATAGVAERGAAAGGAADDLGYEVQYLLDSDDVSVDRLRSVLDGLGDSLVMVGTGDGTWNVHVHVAAAGIGAALEAGVVAGRPHRIAVTPLEQARPHAHAVEPVAEAPAPAGGRSAVVVAAGDGLTALFEAEGATVVRRNPSIGEMLAAVTATGAGCVVLLPNDANTHAVASAAAREAEASGVRVSVVPTRSPVQALAALAVRDVTRAFADDVIAMAEAAGACRYGEVCTAQRDSLTVAGPCRAGELLGLVDGEVHVIGADLDEVSRRLLDRMLGGGGELTTLVLGAAAPPTLEDSLRAHVTQAWPFVELQSYAGGQPRYHLLVGVE